MFCRMLCSDAQCCYNRSCGNRLFPCFVVCCVVMHSIVITALVENMGTICYHKRCYNNTVHHYTTYGKTWEQSVTTRSVITTLHHYTTYDKTWEQSVTTGDVITTLCITTQHTTKHGNNLLPQELL
jgi:hypothetical protein